MWFAQFLEERQDSDNVKIQEVFSPHNIDFKELNPLRCLEIP